MPYPVSTGNDAGIVEGLNYVLSGPGGLGQNFQGFSSRETAYLTGNFRIPFTQAGAAKLYVPAINLANAEQLDDRTIKYTFDSTQAKPPFSLGNGLYVTGVTPATFDSDSLKAAGYSTGQIGVVECTTTYVIVRTVDRITSSLGTYVSGGSIRYVSTQNEKDSGYISTDCNARVTIQGGDQRVLVSSQLTQTLKYQVISGPSDLNVWVVINRYVGATNNDPVNPDYVFERDLRLMRKIYYYTGLTGTGTIDLETVFSTILDSPPPGYYWYIQEVLFEYPATGGVEIQITEDKLGARSLSAQAVKF
jgi:hypothetical protein